MAGAIGSPSRWLRAHSSSSPPRRPRSWSAAAPSAAPTDPVVIKGSEVPALQSVAAGDVVAFSWVDGWAQVAVQVDERKQVDLGTVYNAACHRLRHDRLRRCRTPSPAPTRTPTWTPTTRSRSGRGRRPGGAGRCHVTGGHRGRLRREAQPEHVHRRQDEEGLDLPLQAQRQPEPGRRQAVRGLQLQPAVGRLQDHLQARRTVPTPRTRRSPRRTTPTTSRIAGSTTS